MYVTEIRQRVNGFRGRCANGKIGRLKEISDMPARARPSEAGGFNENEAAIDFQLRFFRSLPLLPPLFLGNLGHLFPERDSLK